MRKWQILAPILAFLLVRDEAKAGDKEETSWHVWSSFMPQLMMVTWMWLLAAMVVLPLLPFTKNLEEIGMKAE